MFGWNDNFPLSGPCRISQAAVKLILILYHIDSIMTFFALDMAPSSLDYTWYCMYPCGYLDHAMHMQDCVGGYEDVYRMMPASARTHVSEGSILVHSNWSHLNHLQAHIYPYVAIIACQAKCCSWSIKSFLPIFVEPVILVTCSHKTSLTWWRVNIINI